MLCCEYFQHNSELAVLENPQKCLKHDGEVIYICLEDDQSCQQACLLCNQCLIDHQTHKWMPLEQYFSKQFKYSLKTGTSKYGEPVMKLASSVMRQIRAMKKKINDKIDEFMVDMTMQMQELKILFPIKSGFGLANKGHLLNNDNVRDYRVVCERQKNGDWIKASENFFMRMIKESSLMICNFFDDFHSHLADRDYTTFTKENSRALADNFMKKYEGIFSQDTRYFKLCTDQRHINIRVSADEREARYVKGSGQPTVLTKNNFNRKHNIVYFQVTKFEKTLLIFDKQLVVVGACLPDKIKTYAYKGAMQPSHGGFGLGSNGRVYHSNLFKYEKADIGFKYGHQDILSVEIDYAQKMIKFEKKTGYFKKKFEMELDLNEEDMDKIKPFIMFDGEDGAIVRILEEYETGWNYQRRLKKLKQKRRLDNVVVEQ